MRCHLLLTAVAVMVMLATGGTTEAQTPAPYVSITSAGYLPAAGGQPASSRPQGTYSTPLNNLRDWRIDFVWGTLDANGDFQTWAGSPNVRMMLPQPQSGQGVYLAPWVMPAPVALVNPPPNLYVQAYLKSRPPGGAWTGSLAGFLAACP